MRVVVVSQRVDVVPDRKETRDALDQRLGALLLVAGFLPVPVPNSLCPDAQGRAPALDEWLDKINPHALVLSGGNDVGTCQERDRVEGGLLDYCARRNLPALGICRGMQMMSVWAGGALRTVTGHVGVRHMIEGEISAEVNSYHNVALLRCPPEFKVLAKSRDHEIEAIRHHKLAWEGWMWHPERETSFEPRDIDRLKSLFNR